MLPQEVKSGVPLLLDDEQYLRFLVDGYLILKPASLTDDDHNLLFQRGSALYETARTLKSPTAHLEILGDNLRAEIPEIDRVLEDGTVKGAVTSILGEDAVLHPHNFLHQSTLADQCFHHDGNLPWNERGHYRSHRPDWLILFYYPQAVTEENGPTEVIPGSAYWTLDHEIGDNDWHSIDLLDRDFGRDVQNAEDLGFRDQRLQDAVDSLQIPQLERKFVHLPKGSVVLVHYDLLHRGSRKLPDSPDRFMFKFHFARTHEPAGPAWKNTMDSPPLEGTKGELQPVIQQIWDWSKGKVKPVDMTSHTDNIAQSLFSGREDQKVESAYRLGMDTSEAAIEILQQGINHDQESTRRASCYGLRTAGFSAISALVQACSSERPSTRRFAVYALGNIATATEPSAIEVMIELLKDPDDLVRSNAAYALGQVSRSSNAGPEILEALIPRLDPELEPNNTEVALLPRSTVRQSVAYGLMQYCFNHQVTAEHLSTLVTYALEDDDRYIKGMLLEAIVHLIDNNSEYEIATRLIRGLMPRRINLVSPPATKG